MSSSLEYFSSHQLRQWTDPISQGSVATIGAPSSRMRQQA
jgi:hypothetical protein